ncbi:MAG: alpha-amylase family glycosyl hydrolase [Bacteroidetes bacterium]|nr:alpha-amylase family glycosyl hydrolase [Bacteroidota bacterium]
MKKACLLMMIFFVAVSGNAQLLKTTPEFVQDNTTSFDIVCDASFGNKAILNYTPTADMYVHIGLITSQSTNSTDWKYVKYPWASPGADRLCTYLGTNKWKFTITGGIRAFFGVTAPAEKILKIAVLFRNGTGATKQANTDGSDMYIPVYDNSNYVRITDPFRQPLYTPTPEPITKIVGNTLSVSAVSTLSSDLKILLNGTQIGSQTAATTLTTSTTILIGGTQTIIAEALNAGVTIRDTLSFFVSGGTTVAPLPAGLKQGINYETDPTACTLVLYAPLKTRVSVLGDFNNWTESAPYQMNQTPDGTTYWLRLTGLTSGVEYAYQYLVDGSLKVADYNTEKILDPNNDQYISPSTYPNLKAYPTNKTTGIVSILQTAKPAYVWQTTSFSRPDKSNLVIYELLIRDFVATQSIQTVKDTLTYLKRLGVNAIELMPFNEFEGNNSWGYNPSFYFAPDKAYGTENAVRAFIDECHKQGIAVIMDMVLNHSFGSSPMVQLYWDAANSRPAANSPWFNPIAKHPFNVGYDFNHESVDTKAFVDRVLDHWLTNYKVDGFRFDLSKGFTQVDNLNNVNAWGSYDASRVAIWKRIYDKMQTLSTNSYCILEHFAANQEEIELSNYGMMLWGNSNYAFNQATMGFTSGSDLQSTVFNSPTRGWSKPLLVGYMESHDEERLAYKNTTYGNVSGAYSTKDLATSMKRNEMGAAFWAMIPGPKSMWQFGELGYDYSINTCSDGTTVDPNNCRLSTKPIRWDYYSNASRKSLFDVYSKLFKLKLKPNYLSTFTTSNSTYDLASNVKWLKLTTDSLNVVVIGNFDVVAASTNISFPTAGTWYSYLTGSTRTATGSVETINLQPGEYYVYTNKDVNNSVPTAILPSGPVSLNMQLNIAPNPTRQHAMISYDLPESGQVSINMLSLAGNRLGSIYKGYQTKGIYSLSLNNTYSYIGSAPNGMYLVQLLINGKQKIEKLIIEK